MKLAKSEWKDWARKNMKGLAGCILPSFTPDLSELDEEGIRWDVQQHIKHGFFSILAESLCCGMTTKERKRFVEIACEEAGGRVSVMANIFYNSLEESIAMLQHAEKAGCHTAMLGYPINFYPQSEEDVYRTTKMMCESANLGIVLYPSHKYNFARFHPSAFNPGLLNRMADIENAVAMKVGILSPAGYTAECFRLVGHKVLVNCPEEGMWSITVPKYGQQWAGPSNYVMCQTPDNPRLVEHFNLLVNGDIDRAMDIFWSLAPIQSARAAALNATLAGGLYHFTLWKYWQWLVGCNGGLLRQPIMPLYEHNKEGIKAALKAAGITPREPEEEFYVGRVNYARGARLKV